MGVPEMIDPLTQLSLPPGFRFYPTDEELMVNYLCRKVAGHHFSLPIIADIDLYKFDPWVLPGKALFGEKEWYFFSPRDRKYPNGSRPNRVAGSGYWKATGTDKVITSAGKKVGIKKALVFYIGKAPKGTKTNWIMHEYRLFQSSCKSGGSKLDDWVLCRIYKKSSNGGKPIAGSTTKEELSSSSTSSSYLEDVMESSSSFPVIDVDQFFAFPRATNQEEQKVMGFQNIGSGCGFDWNMWAGLVYGPDVGATGLGSAQLGCQVPLPSLPPLCHVDSPQEEEVRIQRANVSGYSGSVDPFGIRYGASMAGFGFGQ